MSIWKLTTGEGSALLYKGDTHAGKLSSVLKNEVVSMLNEYEFMKQDYERLKTQIRLCEEHASGMAKDFDLSLSVVRQERDALRKDSEQLDRVKSAWKAQRGRIIENMGSDNPRMLEVKNAIEQ